MNELRKKAMDVLAYRAEALEMSSRMANGPGNLLGEDADFVSRVLSDAARVLREGAEMLRSGGTKTAP